MSKDSAAPLDEFGTIIEQLRKVQAAIRVCIRGIQDAKNRAWEWRDRRDELREASPRVNEEISKQRTGRDKLNVEVQRLKQLRDQETAHARTLQDEMNALRQELVRKGEVASLEELQSRYRELEWQQQTTSLSVEEERALIIKLEELNQAIEKTKQAKRETSTQSVDLDALWEEIQAARDQAQQYHEQMTALVEEAQQKHQHVLHLAQGLDPNRMEIDEAHQKFVECLKEADEMRDRLDELRAQEAELKDELDVIGKRRRETRAERERKAMEQLAELARAKQQAGQKLTIQELRALMETGNFK